MGTYTSPKKVKLIIGVLLRNSNSFIDIQKLLESHFGPTEDVLEPFAFTWTNYYEDELGSTPLRAFFSFENLIPRENLPQIKRITNQLELANTYQNKRLFNLDPGYLSVGQFFLATTKDQRHRIYLGGGIFGEVTLYYKDGGYHPFFWTYRDYKSEIYHQFFLLCRKKLTYQLKTGRPYPIKAE